MVVRGTPPTVIPKGRQRPSIVDELPKELQTIMFQHLSGDNYTLVLVLQSLKSKYDKLLYVPAVRAMFKA